ncbi:peptidoglycan editing factor PgeF [Cyanobium sp. CH-040]|uniref:peptidoglycan editing factor PgeF n=1 Tax=Cyanobium sp. CH-040 TaxID=2823708 RepID=UPI0020CB6AE6|nr:peptidoglycan editing factor PgeF [Cyanobium sp. CH-040]MCP9928155.1 peptidoglycan editing factor PgeF [Cyanobium sp. CH-040]
MAEAVDPPFDRPDVGFNDLSGWTWVGCYGGYYLQAELLREFEHGFFTRQWQGREPEVLAGYLSAGVTVHRPRQVHSAVVLTASAAREAPWPESDGLCSDAGGQSLWVCGADCTPVLLADPVRGAVAACHAGWRGVAGRILAAAVEMLAAAGSRPADLLVALGPAVSGARYQVERAVSEQVAAGLDAGSVAAGLTLLREAGALLEDPEPGRERLDIRAVARLQLHRLGVADERISVCPLCTVSEPDLFHSWRRDQVKAVQWSGIVSQA